MKIDLLEWFVYGLFISLCILGIVNIYFQEINNTKVGYCLEPLAKKICKENNFSYNFNDDNFVSCEQGRKVDKVVFKFYEDEKVECGK